MRRILLIAIVTALPLLSSAQVTTNPLNTEFGARMELTLDKYLTDALHLQLEGEARTTHNFTDIGRYDAGLCLTYRLNQYFKFDLGYKFIENKGLSGKWKMRHRVYADTEAALHTGNWDFSLRERLQLTHKDGNAIEKQTTPNSLTLKSRLQAVYNGFLLWKPYAYIELRNVFNDPACSFTLNTVTQSFDGYEFLGYNHAYLNRIRGSIGSEWKLDRHNSLDIHFLTDYCREKEIETAGNGTTLKALYWDQTFYGALCVGYKFSF